MASATLFILLAGCGNGDDNGVLESERPGGSPTVARIEISPASVELPVGGLQQFQAFARMTDGSSTNAALAYSAGGGSITPEGLYTAGPLEGTFRVIATGDAGLADTAAVRITAVEPPQPSYEAVVADNWQSYQSRDDLRGTRYFWWYLQDVDVHEYLDLVPDSVFGKVVRYRFEQSTDAGYAPKSHINLPRPLEKMWLRWRMRYTPGWTTAGPLPANYANSYKVAFWLWDGFDSRGQLEISNTDQYQTGLGVLDPANGRYLQYTQTSLPGSQDFGRVTSEWADGEWYEFVAYYEKTGPTSARQRWWRRRLTQNSEIVDNPWVYTGIELSGERTPLVRAVRLGETKNKANPFTMYISWGPWEIVDGSRYPNPWNMPNVQ